MSQSWTNRDAGPDLLLALEPSVGRREALERALRAAIRQGRLPAGSRVPPSRVLARDLGLARGTVVDAYSQLVAEGYLTARQGAGTVVTPRAPAPPTPAPEPPVPRRPRFDFHPGVPDLTSFPAQAWRRAPRPAPG